MTTRPFIKLDAEAFYDPRLKPLDKLILMYAVNQDHIIKSKNPSTRWILRQEDVKKYIGVADKTAATSIERLKEAGYVTIDEKYRDMNSWDKYIFHEISMIPLTENPLVEITSERKSKGKRLVKTTTDHSKNLRVKEEKPLVKTTSYKEEITLKEDIKEISSISDNDLFLSKALEEIKNFKNWQILKKEEIDRFYDSAEKLLNTSKSESWTIDKLKRMVKKSKFMRAYNDYLEKYMADSLKEANRVRIQNENAEAERARTQNPIVDEDYPCSNTLDDFALHEDTKDTEEEAKRIAEEKAKKEEERKNRNEAEEAKRKEYASFIRKILNNKNIDVEEDTLLRIVNLYKDESIRNIVLQSIERYSKDNTTHIVDFIFQEVSEHLNNLSHSKEEKTKSKVLYFPENKLNTEFDVDIAF